MDCREFDGQVVRLEKIKEVADKFVRVRLTRIEQADLSLFTFDYDLTLMMFFMNAEDKIYARYCGRDANDADNRQSLEGLRYTMNSVLAMHDAETKYFAPRLNTKTKTIRDVPQVSARGCVHCHNVKEALNRELIQKGEWSRDWVYRYPLPENLGIRLDVNRSNIVQRVTTASLAEKAGVKVGDQLQMLGTTPIHSFADVQYALDIAPVKGDLEMKWLRGKETLSAKTSLPEGWKKSDLSWRPSMQRLIPTVPFSGEDLKADDRQKLGLKEKQLAFRQGTRLHDRAKEAGFHVGDVIVAIDDKTPEVTFFNFIYYVRENYLVGDTVTVTVLRDGKPLKIPVTLASR